MARVITITAETIRTISVKTVVVDIDGKRIRETYTYPGTAVDATINTEINADLDTKGYAT